MPAEDEKLSIIDQARAMFGRMGKDRVSPNFLAQNIEDMLKLAGLGFGVLDPNGKASDADMAARFRAKIRRLNIAEARKVFKELTSKRGIRSVARLDRHLEIAEAGYETLDPTGKKSREEMAAEVRRREKMYLIREARRSFSVIDDTEYPSDLMRSVYTALERADADITALDPTGKKSRPDMEREIKVKMLKAKERTNIAALESLLELIESGFLETELGGSHVVSQETADNVRAAIDYQHAARFFTDDKDVGSKPSAPGNQTKRPASRKDFH